MFIDFKLHLLANFRCSLSLIFRVPFYFCDKYSVAYFHQNINLCKYVTHLNVNHEVCCLRALFKSWYYIKKTFFKIYISFYITFIFQCMQLIRIRFFCYHPSCIPVTISRKKWTFCELFLCFSGEFYFALFECVSHFNPDFYSKIVWFTSSITTDVWFLAFYFPNLSWSGSSHLIHCFLIAKLPSTDSSFSSCRIWFFFSVLFFYSRSSFRHLILSVVIILTLCCYYDSIVKKMMTLQ